MIMLGCCGLQLYIQESCVVCCTVFSVRWVIDAGEPPISSWASCTPWVKNGPKSHNYEQKGIWILFADLTQYLRDGWLYHETSWLYKVKILTRFICLGWFWLIDYFERTGKSLLVESDENVEAVHSKYRQFLERHHYHVNDTSSPIQHLKQHKSLVHWNSVNI